MILIYQISPINTLAITVDDEDSSFCPCENCTEWSCICECTSEETCTCIQCKRNVNAAYDENGNLLLSEAYDGVKTLKSQNIYSADGTFLLSSIDNSGNAIYYEYNDDGLLETMSSGDTEIDFTYNSLYQLSKVSQTVSNLSEGTEIANEYTYDGGKITSITHNGFTYNFTYDEYGNQTVVKINDTVYLTNEYGGETNDRLGKINYSNGQSITYIYMTLMII